MTYRRVAEACPTPNNRPNPERRSTGFESCAAVILESIARTIFNQSGGPLPAFNNLALSESKWGELTHVRVSGVPSAAAVDRPCREGRDLLVVGETTLTPTRDPSLVEIHSRTS